MRRFLASVLAALLLTSYFASGASADSVDNCRIAASSRQPVSLGFPLRSERLAKMSNPKILVLPYHLNGEPTFILSDKEKSNFIQAGKNINSYSEGNNRIDFIFNPTIEIPDTVEDMNSLKFRQQTSWMDGDYTNSTWGFVEKVISLSDKNVDYSGINAVVLYGQPSVRSAEIAEAMMYSNDSTYLSIGQKKKDGSSWAKPLKTAEGEISNAVLIFNRTEVSTISHELMHLYGLTDLYGSQTSPRFSLMVDSSDKLLPFEEWVLGWLPDSNVQCVNLKTELEPFLKGKTFSINYSSGDHSLVIPTSRTSALVVDVLKWDNGQARIIFYALENEARPPITCYFPTGSMCGDVTLHLYGGVGKHFASPAYNLVVTDNDGSNVEIALIPKNQINTEDSIQLIAKAQSKAIDYELKGRREAADKAAADKAAADKAAADKAAADKAAADKAAATKPLVKQVTVTCLKGKTSIRVVGKNPKCPAGYKKKA